MNTGIITHLGKTWQYQHEDGFYSHVLILLERIDSDTTMSTSGRATITLLQP